MYNRTATSMLTILGLPLVTLGVYLLGVCRADNYLACPSTMSATIDSVNFLNVAGSNYCCLQKTCQNTNKHNIST